MSLADSLTSRRRSPEPAALAPRTQPARTVRFCHARGATGFEPLTPRPPLAASSPSAGTGGRRPLGTPRAPAPPRWWRRRPRRARRPPCCARHGRSTGRSAVLASFGASSSRARGTSDSRRRARAIEESFGVVDGGDVARASTRTSSERAKPYDSQIGRELSSFGLSQDSTRKTDVEIGGSSTTKGGSRSRSGRSREQRV